MQKANTFYCPKKGQNIDMNLGFNFIIIEKIGEGSYGEVFKILDVQKSRLLIIKRQKKASSSSTKNAFQAEHELILKLAAFPGFMKVGPFVRDENHEYFMTDCLGSSLEELMSKHNPLSICTIKWIGYSIVQRLQVLHEMGYLHRDIKTDNIMVGDSMHSHELFLIDYGLALQFKKDGVQIEKRKYSGLIGTARYASVAAHQFQEQSPKDDLESLGYVLTYCVRGSLHWQDLPIDNKQERFARIKKIKKEATLDMLSNDYPCLKKYYSYVKSLKYEDTPDYELLKSFFVYREAGKHCFEWCNHNCPTKCKNLQNQEESISVEDVQAQSLKKFPEFQFLRNQC